jgi:predicted HicB family RNase H-like nuclease
MAKYSDAQKEATARYNKKAYDRIDVIVPKGQRQIIKDFAAAQGKSLNRFICDAIQEQMNKGKTE